MTRQYGDPMEVHSALGSEVRLDAAALHLILGHVPAVIWKYSPTQKRMLFASEYILELSGLEREAFLKNPELWDAQVGQDPPSRQARIALLQAMRDGRPCEVAYRFQTLHRGERWFKVTAQPASEDGEVFYYGCTTDITEHRQAEETMHRLARALEQADEAFIITNPQGRIEYVNAAFERMTGYTRDEAIGQTPSILKSGRQDEAFYRELWQTIRGGRPWRGRFINRRKDGSFYEQWATITPLYDGGEAIIGFIAVQLDMTHQLELERRLAQAERLASVGEAIAWAAHSIKNILNTMRGSAFMLDRALLQDVPDKVRELWEVYSRSTSRLDQLTRRMLDFVRISQLALEPQDLNALCQEVVESCRAGAERFGIKLELEQAATLPHVPCDREMLHDAVLNLVSNAIDACAETEARRIVVSTCRLSEEAAVELCVEDDGPGIKPENMEQLFRPFFSTKGHHGNGLGLAMVQKTIQAHGGAIKVASEPGRTCFTIRLPL